MTAPETGSESLLADRSAPRPEWALAYIMQDWTKRARPTLRRAYELASLLADKEHDGEYVPDVLREAVASDLAVALRKMRAYVAALEEVQP